MIYEEIPIEKLDVEVLDGDRGKNYPHKDELMDAGYCLFLSANNVTDDGFNFDSPVFISKEKDSALRGGKLKRNDIVITTRGTIGNVCHYNHLVPYENMRINSGMLIIRCGRNINSEYLYYALRSSYFQAQIRLSQTGSAQPQLPKSLFVKLKVNIPPLSKQEEIANILATIDRKIDNNVAINENLHRQLDAMFEKSCLHGTEATMTSLLKEIESGSRPKGGALTNGIPSIGAEKIEKFGVYNYKNEKYISQEYFSQLKRGIVESGDVLLYKDGAYTGKVSMALDGFPHNVCAINEHVFILRTQEKRFQSFLYACLSQESVRQSIYTLAASKAAQPGLNKQDLLTIKVILPSQQELNTFEDMARPIMKLIAINALENKKLKEMREISLSKLMTGEIEV